MENFCDCFLKYIKNNEESLNTFVKNELSARNIKFLGHKDEIFYFFVNQHSGGFGLSLSFKNQKLIDCKINNKDFLFEINYPISCAFYIYNFVLRNYKDLLTKNIELSDEFLNKLYSKIIDAKVSMVNKEYYYSYFDYKNLFFHCYEPIMLINLNTNDENTRIYRLNYILSELTSNFRASYSEDIFKFFLAELGFTHDFAYKFMCYVQDSKSTFRLSEVLKSKKDNPYLYTQVVKYLIENKKFVSQLFNVSFDSNDDVGALTKSNLLSLYNTAFVKDKNNLVWLNAHVKDDLTRQDFAFILQAIPITFIEYDPKFFSYFALKFKDEGINNYLLAYYFYRNNRYYEFYDFYSMLSAYYQSKFSEELQYGDQASYLSSYMDIISNKTMKASNFSSLSPVVLFESREFLLRHNVTCLPDVFLKHLKKEETKKNKDDKAIIYCLLGLYDLAPIEYGKVMAKSIFKPYVDSKTLSSFKVYKAYKDKIFPANTYIYME